MSKIGIYYHKQAFFQGPNSPNLQKKMMKLKTKIENLSFKVSIILPIETIFQLKHLVLKLIAPLLREDQNDSKDNRLLRKGRILMMEGSNDGKL